MVQKTIIYNGFFHRCRHIDAPSSHGSECKRVGTGEHARNSSTSSLRFKRPAKSARLAPEGELLASEPQSDSTRLTTSLLAIIFGRARRCWTSAARCLFRRISITQGHDHLHISKCRKWSAQLHKPVLR